VSVFDSIPVCAALPARPSHITGCKRYTEQANLSPTRCEETPFMNAAILDDLMGGGPPRTLAPDSRVLPGSNT